MIQSAKLFYHYLTETLKEVRNDFKIYLVYIVGLCIISIVQIFFDSFLLKEELALRFFSKILFSMVPLLILSKILYVIKIRTFGMADYGLVMWRFILYTFYYFFILILSLSLCMVAAFFVGSRFDMQTSYIISSFLLIPFFYILIYYSLSPYVAVFSDNNNSVLSQSKLLSSKNISLVILNHLFSLIPPIFFSSFYLIENSTIKLTVALFFAVPEAIFAILTVLTTTKIYLYLTSRD